MATRRKAYDARNHRNYQAWRSQVLKRDGKKCVVCRQPGNIAHHLFEYHASKKLRLIVENGVTLCKACHKAYHDQYLYISPTTFMKFVRAFDRRMAKLMSSARREKKEVEGSRDRPAL